MERIIYKEERKRTILGREPFLAKRNKTVSKHAGTQYVGARREGNMNVVV